MKLVRWSPLEEMSILRDQIDRIFEPMVAPNGHDSTLTRSLPVEVTETPTQYRVRVMIPGVNPEQIQLQATKKELSVLVELKPRELEKDETVHLNQFQYGKFSKTLTFQETVETDTVDARYEFGILDIFLTKAEISKRKPIQIQVKQ